MKKIFVFLAVTVVILAVVFGYLSSKKVSQNVSFSDFDVSIKIP